LGKVKDQQGNKLSNLFVEVFDDEFGISDEQFGNGVTSSTGDFEITFDDKAFRPIFKFLGRRPNLYIVVRDSFKVLYKSEVHYDSKDTEYFDIVIESIIQPDDPYSNSLAREIALFSAIGDTIDIAQVDIPRAIEQMIRAIGNWSYYTTPKIMQLYGYPGPQVPQYPKRVPHKHSLLWNQKNQ